MHPVVAELRFGAEWSSSPTIEKVKTNAFISSFAQLTFDDAATIEYALIRTDLAKRGQLMSEMDLLIASIARANDLTLVTHNTSEFSRVPGLKLVDWEVP
jgi:tRNA(fMet)-specific endonuclease VapC